MQLPTNFVRELGYRKITSCEFPLVEIAQLDLENRDIRVVPYSFLNEYEAHGSLYHSMDALIDYVGGMEGVSALLDSVRGGENSRFYKRKFTNTWAQIWEGYVQSLDCQQNVETLLSDFGLRLAFIASDDPVIRNVARFYDDVIGWFIYTCGRYDSKETMRRMVVQDMDSMRSLYKVW